ncbi:hypothetical protein V3C99_013617, partial [Haemonchus contortus]
IFATPALVIFYRILNRSFLFHRNLVIITKYHYCMLYMALPSRIIIILYVVKLCPLTHSCRRLWNGSWLLTI